MIFERGGFCLQKTCCWADGWGTFRVSCFEFLVIELETSNSKLETNQPTAKTFYSPWLIARCLEEPRDPTRDCGNVRNCV